LENAQQQQQQQQQQYNNASLRLSNPLSGGGAGAGYNNGQQSTFPLSTYLNNDMFKLYVECFNFLLSCYCNTHLHK
jgi:hypothetical protein